LFAAEFIFAAEFTRTLNKRSRGKGERVGGRGWEWGVVTMTKKVITFEDDDEK